MDPNVAYDRLQTLLCEQLDLPGAAVSRERALDELGLDSVERVELLGRLEEAFEVAIDPGQAVHLTTVDALVRYLAARAD